MAMDGLEDAYERGKAMGVFAETCAEQYGFSREQQDEYAKVTTQRAQLASTDGSFLWEMAPVTIEAKGHSRTITQDEQPAKAKLDKVHLLKPAFKPGGTITAANASSISDGAAALVMMREHTAVRLGSQPIARLVAHAVHAQAPAQFSTAPAGAIHKVLAKAGWAPREVDLWEINEAFAVVTMAAMKDFGLPHDIVNVHGGAVALGHPIGASGARIVVTLLGALRKLKLRKGVAALCIGGGEATALAVELI
jgi:acetyl-CoA C-acetyltransferase